MQSPAASPALSGLDDVYGGNLGDEQEVDTDDGGSAVSGPWKNLRSKLNYYRHLRIDRHDLEVSCSLNGLLNWFIAGTSTAAPLFAIPLTDIANLGITMLRTSNTSLEQ